MCDKAILENAGALNYVPDCYKNQEMCNKVVEKYPHAIEFVPECYKIQKMCNKAVDTYPSKIKFVPEYYETQKSVIEQFIDAFLYLILFLINIKLKKYIT